MAKQVKGKILTSVYLNEEKEDKQVVDFMEAENRSKTKAIERLVQIALRTPEVQQIIADYKNGK
ncbi:hypothetical protein [Streptomyces sp. ID01-9D]|uniref:hypothetical protein n=1 Tax=Streptomyces sp. ID01-9D TaxID=3028659 RepID=UPI0029C3FDF0|nr:hypothetical protein [Streptomyces sp. ID01-9D]MDX5578361.1 hypothetical protein [Streptomyces sp. ID01-9D]